MECIREIYVVGALMAEQGLCDKHLEMDEKDYALLEWLRVRTAELAEIRG